jgi:hypothetical protein
MTVGIETGKGELSQVISTSSLEAHARKTKEAQEMERA